jgi:hypothetical protein
MTSMLGSSINGQHILSCAISYEAFDLELDAGLVSAKRGYCLAGRWVHCRGTRGLILAEKFVKDQAADDVSRMLMAGAQQISPRAQWETNGVT